MKEFGTAVILAGGNSRRMGFDKQLLRIKEKRLMDIIIRKLSLEFSEIIIVSNKPQYYLGSNYPIVGDIFEGKGPLGGIHSGLVESNSRYAYFIACDMPNINIDYIKYLKAEIGSLDVKACITKYGDHIEPFNAFYSRDMIKDIEDYLLGGKRSIKPLLERVGVHYIEEVRAKEFSPNWEMFLNLNTKEDLEALSHR